MRSVVALICVFHSSALINSSRFTSMRAAVASRPRTIARACCCSSDVDFKLRARFTLSADAPLPAAVSARGQHPRWHPHVFRPFPSDRLRDCAQRPTSRSKPSSDRGD